jgi:hypothetical protein
MEEVMMSRLCTILSATILAAAAAGAQAAVTVGGRSFADNAFADAVAIPAVSFILWDGVTSVPESSSTDANKARAAMLDTPIGNPTLAASTFAGCAIGQTEAQCGTIRVSFTDNRIVNGPGADFTVFDINNPSNVKATINGVTLVRATVVAGTTPRPPGLGSAPWVLNAADFDLSDFGLAAGAQVDAVDFYWGLGETTQDRAGFALVGAVNSVPEPASAWLFAAGLAAVAAGAARRARR